MLFTVNFLFDLTVSENMQFTIYHYYNFQQTLLKVDRFILL